MKDKQTSKHINKQTREPLSKGDSGTGLIVFLIQLSLATLASLTHFILHTSEGCNSNKHFSKELAFWPHFRTSKPQILKLI